ncbi:FecR family protein [Flavivirga spongiicola]|uniref:FecR family protein n=1 Tax=Flavivirga spongiicola TaxID=421621 RepID=A0ABU7XR23_9FLAO|nr:FecR family protein [Flavivirga sp. MEBiC05379]MDO5978232.1 FecR family protein [Flavivirga sp. MEBiC05379]
MITKRIQKLIAKYLVNQASFSELDELEQWLKDSDNEKEFARFVKTNYLIEYNLKKFNKDITKLKLYDLIEQEKKVLRLKRIQKYSRYVAAAVVVGILATGYFFKDNIFSTPIEQTPTIVNTKAIVPGTDKATLTLGDGSIVVLKKGNTYQGQNANSNGEEIIYEASKQKPTEIVYNYLTVPRGGEYYIVLSDGTRVWLNSESQLKYPESFIEGETREVELVYGEAYFDVSPSTEHKGSNFKVFNRSQEVEVLGTEFNIKAYKDEVNIYTTLVEGRVVVDNGISKQNLIPNQQSNLDLEKNSIKVTVVDVEGEISWKNGVFSFKGKSLKNIMRVISRWYDVDVIFLDKNLEELKFKGVLSKNQSIEEILSIMKSSTISDYKIKDKTIILK